MHPYSSRFICFVRSMWSMAWNFFQFSIIFSRWFRVVIARPTKIKTINYQKLPTNTNNQNQKILKTVTKFKPKSKRFENWNWNQYLFCTLSQGTYHSQQQEKYFHNCHRGNQRLTNLRNFVSFSSCNFVLCTYLTVFVNFVNFFGLVLERRNENVRSWKQLLKLCWIHYPQFTPPCVNQLFWYRDDSLLPFCNIDVFIFIWSYKITKKSLKRTKN